MKKWTYLCLLTLVATLGLATAVAADSGTWTGEVVDLACYVANGDGGKGTDHAGCAKSCLKAGQPMGLLTDDGTLVLLAADHKNGEAYETLKELAGQKAEVSGNLAERNGVNVVTVTESKKAS
jgi:hypothetical protein